MWILDGLLHGIQVNCELLTLDDHIRHKAITYLVLIIMGMILLSASLQGLEFKPGLPIPGAETTSGSPEPADGSDVLIIETENIFKIPFAILFVAFLINIIFRLVKNLNFKSIFKPMVGLLVLILLAVILDQIKINPLTIPTGGQSDINIIPPVLYQVEPIGDPPKVIIHFITIFLLLGFAVLMFLLVYKTIQRSEKEDLISSETGAALKAIAEGNDLGSVIIRCYLQLINIVKDEYGIEREESITQSEFERLLNSRGIPSPPLHELTALFEKVRYGGKMLNEKDEKTALDCLSAIRTASCHSGKEELS